MSHKNKTDEINRLRAIQEELLKEKEEKENQEKELERKSRKAKFPILMQLAIAAMRSNNTRTWNNKNNKQSPIDAVKKAELNEKVKETREAFVKAYRQIVSNDLKNWWEAELQKEYIKGAPKALLEYYLSDNPEKTRDWALSLEEAANEYVYGWELLGQKKQQELPGPIERISNGALAVQVLIERLKRGNKIQEIQAEILEMHFENPITCLGNKPAEPLKVEGFILGDVTQQTGSAE